MKLTQLALILIAAQLFVAAAVSYALTTKSHRPRLVRGLGILIFVCLEAALLIQIFEASTSHLVQARDILAYTALAAAIALAFGSGDNLLGLLHRTRRDLSRSENLSQTLFERSSEPIVFLDSSGDILDSNIAACEQLGYQKEKLCSLSLIDIVHPDEIAVLLELPDDRRVAEAYSRGHMAVRVLPEWSDSMLKLWGQVKASVDRGNA